MPVPAAPPSIHDAIERSPRHAPIIGSRPLQPVVRESAPELAPRAVIRTPTSDPPAFTPIRAPTRPPGNARDDAAPPAAAAAAPTTEPPVIIEIGAVEFRTIATAPPAPPAPERRVPTLTLDAYLAQRAAP
jgi:hypothetical protein